MIAPYLDLLRATILRAVNLALATAVPAALEWRIGRCGVAYNRDFRDPKLPRYLCGANPAGEADDALLIGRVTAEGGRIVAILVNYACHPTTLAWQNQLMSPDFVGSMRELVEAITAGAYCLFLQGASGELAPREQYAGDTEVADRHGRELGFAVLSTLEGMSSVRSTASVFRDREVLSFTRHVGIEAHRLLFALECAAYRREL